MPRCAVLGDPIEHSLSPVLHRAAYEALGLEDWTYDAHRVAEESLASFIDGLDGTWRGLSLTMPLKRTVMPLLDDVAPTAERAGAANTVVLRDGRRTGDNTDVPGAVAAIRERHAGGVDAAVVLGGGATAASALLALADLGCAQATVAVRDPVRAEQTLAAVRRHDRAPALRTAALDGPDAATALRADIVVSTIPASAQTEGLLSRLDDVPVVFDVIYDPWPTPLAARARQSGRTLVGGLDLLVHQAARQVALMTGREDVPLAAMREAGESALSARARGAGH